MIGDLATRGEISWAYGKLYIVDRDQYWVQGGSGGVTLPGHDLSVAAWDQSIPADVTRVMIIASDRSFKMQQSSRLGNVLWLSARDKGRDGTTAHPPEGVIPTRFSQAEICHWKKTRNRYE